MFSIYLDQDFFEHQIHWFSFLLLLLLLRFIIFLFINNTAQH